MLSLEKETATSGDKMRERTEWMSVREVAKVLGVTAPRVRQLVQEKKLPGPTRFGERAHLWSRADVEDLRFTQDGHGIISGRTALLPDPVAPLRRVVDDVFVTAGKGWASRIYEVHVRVFQGVVEDVDRTVVILSELPDGGSITNWFERIASEVTARYLSGNVHAVTWIHTYHSGLSGPKYVLQVGNITMRLDHTEIHQPAINAWFERLVPSGRASTPEEPQKVVFAEPDWNGCSVHEVHRVLGQEIEWYPLEAYTSREIEYWQRHGRPREVEVDPLELKPLVDAVEALSDIPRTHSYSRVARSICPILANVAMVKDSENGRMVPKGTVASFISKREDYTESVGITRSAVKIVPYRLSGNDLDLRAKHVTAPLALPWEHDVIEMTDLHLDLRAWKDETDKYAVDHDEALHGHLEVALDWVSFPAVREELEARRDIYPSGHVRGFDIAGEWDRKYVDSISFRPSIGDTDRVWRILKDQVRFLSGIVRFGVDPFGNKVAHEQGPHGESIYVYWPSIPQEFPLDSDIVADGAPGDRPAYISWAGRIIGLLPQFPASFYNGWNFGYGGGGPGRLAADILEALMWQERLPRDRMPWRWTDDAVCHSSQDHLRLALADVIRRLDTEQRP